MNRKDIDVLEDCVAVLHIVMIEACMNIMVLLLRNAVRKYQLEEAAWQRVRRHLASTIQTTFN